ncbi:MAG: cytochrome b N-terminal domain-containing protein [Planctomycetaceae bacterium]
MTDATNESGIPQQPSRPPGDALRRFVRNLRQTPRLFRESLVRHGRPTSDRAASQSIFGNFFLHILPTRIHKSTLQYRKTLGLGVITTVLFLLLVGTGIALMVYYKPTTDRAYDSMKDIHYVVPTGRFMRNIHRWAAHGMVVCVLLHMARAFYTAAYKSPREFNWVVGMLLFVLTLGLSFTGYLLPWDQLAFWAVTIGSEIAQSPRELTDTLGITSWFDIGGFLKRLILGANHVGEEALIRFYLLHVMVLPLVMGVLLGVHFWRIRKDGGLARPPEDGDENGKRKAECGKPDLTLDPQPSTLNPSKTYGLMAVVRGKTPAVDRAMADTVPTFSNALWAIAALSMTTLAVMLWLGHYVDAPLKEMANPAVPENPAKAPWYFLGLQELVSYSAFMGGIGIPAIIVFGLMLVPYLDRESEGIGVWFGGKRGRKVCLATALFTTAVVIGILALTVNFGWLRDWWPDVPQIVIIFVNPGTLLLLIFVAWSLTITKTMNSTRMGALATFTCFLVAFVILTYFATVHRGPNWQFYWSQSDWPTH